MSNLTILGDTSNEDTACVEIGVDRNGKIFIASITLHRIIEGEVVKECKQLTNDKYYL